MRWGLIQMPVEQRGPDSTLPLITGAYGGHTIHFRRFAAAGGDPARPVSRRETAIQSLRISPRVSRRARPITPPSSTWRMPTSRSRGLGPPGEPQPARPSPMPHASWTRCGASTFAPEGIGAVDLGNRLRPRFRLDRPARLRARGEPLHRHGVTEVPGFYFLGLPWLSRMKSSFLSGVGDDAAYLADHIAARRRFKSSLPALREGT